MKKLALFITLVMMLALFASCEASLGDYMPQAPSGYFEAVDENYQYEDIIENDFVSTSQTTTSYFSLDRNTAAYSLMRKQITSGLTLNKNSVRLEDYINYFNYDYQRPADDALALSGSVFDCAWNARHKLFTIGVAAEEVVFENHKTNNIVFLIDTSGSMYGEDRLGLIQQSFTMLLDCLNDNDTISIVTYAGDSRVALDGARGTEKVHIANVLQDLTASGSTNGQGGIEKAYALAEKYFDANSNNRVILATDGDFNVGTTSKDGLTKLITAKREKGIYLTVLGVGMGNTNDVTMKTLAENGNGNYAYLDTVSEARKVLVEELNGTFNVVAKDAKIGVTFNADVVESFRLIGYESKMMSQEDFENSQKDAGEIGSGHTVTAVYEIELKENAQGEIATAEVRYKNPDTDEDKSVSKTYTTSDYTLSPSEDNAFISCVVEFGLILRESQYKNDAALANVISRLSNLQCVTDDPFKAEFLEIVNKSDELYNKNN